MRLWLLKREALSHLSYPNTGLKAVIWMITKRIGGVRLLTWMFPSLQANKMHSFLKRIEVRCSVATRLHTRGSIRGTWNNMVIPHNTACVMWRVVSWRCHDVTMMLTWCYHGVTMVLPWCYHDVTMVLPWCYHEITMMLPWCYHDVTMTLPCYHGVTVPRTFLALVQYLV